jgi:uncharacterized damage-inducible protein DinB
MDENGLLVDLLEHAYRRQSWHGATLRGSIRGVTAKQAAARPAPGRHSIHEIVLHAAYWKYAVGRRLTDRPRGTFELKGSNWFPVAEPDDGSWKRSVELLDSTHGVLVEAVAAFPVQTLMHTPPGGQVSYWRLISGIAAHDLYHAGQIQLIKKLQKR